VRRLARRQPCCGGWRTDWGYNMEVLLLAYDFTRLLEGSQFIDFAEILPLFCSGLIGLSVEGAETFQEHKWIAHRLPTSLILKGRACTSCIFHISENDH
jgi:hypothetical protein